MFAFIATICASIDVAYLWSLVKFFLHPPGPLDPTHVLRDLAVPAVFSALAFTFGLAWWTILREKRSARGWGIAASLLHTAAMLFGVVADRWIPHKHTYHAPLSDAVLLIAMGVVGLVVFSIPYKRPDLSGKAQETAPITGDGTSKFINKTSGVWGVALSFGLYDWLSHWYRDKGLPIHQRGLHISLLTILLTALLMTFVHEFGHSAVGLALGMKLRAFVVGPFQWRVESGQWKFQFRLMAILQGGGATGIVAPAADFPRKRFVWMIAAGPLANLLTGLLALWVAFTAAAASPVQAGGLLALFGVFSLAGFVANLVPFKTKAKYSDGAKIYQLLFSGPWGDFHQVIAMAGSGVVSASRPRDYDIRIIQRAAEGIKQGPEGLLLRLLAYHCYLDRGQLNDAEWALKEASRIYEASASVVRANLLTVFVFGYACVLRDAAEARRWWDSMEAKKPTRFNVDYWRAKSSLCWIEGNLNEAKAAWEKAADAAMKLPHAGEYEFDRDLCGILLYEIEASAAGQQSPLVAVRAVP
jgi:hypothetical protein